MHYYRTIHADGSSTIGQNRATSLRNARKAGAARVELWNLVNVDGRLIESQVRIVWRKRISTESRYAQAAAYAKERRVLAPTTTDGESHLTDDEVAS